MDRTTDLEAALSFVVRRIGEEGKASGRPLSEEEHSLLKDLPSSNVNYLIWAPELGPPDLVPRNANLERLSVLAKAAYLNDCRINPESLDWEFASGVFKLNRHPMWGILHSAGVKRYRKPFWDRLFLFIAALFPVVAVILIAWKGPPTLLHSAGIVCGTLAIMLLIFFASRQIEQRKLENDIETCRLASRNIGWKTS